MILSARPATMTDMSDNPFTDRQQQDVLRIRLQDGRVMEGSYLTQAGMHFLHVREGGLNGKVEGPFAPEQVASVRVLKNRDEVFEERFERSRGEPVPGALRRDRDGYEARLRILARTAARSSGLRRMQVERQFHDVADEITLAKTKRRWILAEEAWRLHSNAEPTKIDLSGGDMTGAEKFQRPRPQDFDPDPKARRARVVLPDRVTSDPVSPPNMLKALRAAGFNARVSVMGEMTHDTADLLVDFPGGKANGRFALIGARTDSGVMRWRHLWEGNGTRADMMRRARCMRSAEYKLFLTTVAAGTADATLAEDAEPKESFRP